MHARPKTRGMSTAMRRTLERSSAGGVGGYIGEDDDNVLAAINRLKPAEMRLVIRNIMEVMYSEDGYWNADLEWDGDTLSRVAEALPASIITAAMANTDPPEDNEDEDGDG